MKLVAWQHIKAPNDRNGNPRRCYVGYATDGSIAIVHDEGYSGKPDWANSFVVPQLPDINVSVSEYRSFLEAEIAGGKR